MEVVHIVSPLLQTLRDTTGETACFFKSEQHYRVCVATAETRHALRRERHLGKVAPLYAGSASRILLSSDPELMDAVRRDPLTPITESTITTSENLVVAVKPTRRDGLPSPWTSMRTERRVFRPRFRLGGKPGGRGDLSGPTLRMPLETCEAWVETLLTTAEHMTRLIGAGFPAKP